MRRKLWGIFLAGCMGLFLVGCDIGITPLDQNPNEMNIVTTATLAENGDVAEIGIVIPESSGDVDVHLEITGEGSEYFAGTIERNGTSYTARLIPKPDFVTYKDMVFLLFVKMVIDGQELCGKEVQKTIKRTEVAPEAHDQNITLEENRSVTFELNVSDENEDTLTCLPIRVAPKHGTLSGDCEAMTYRPDVDYFGADRFEYAANDGLSNSRGAKVEIEIKPSALSEDTQAPVLTLNGVSEVRLTVGDTYAEEGAVAMDDRDSTVNVAITGAVNTTMVGTYTVVYTASDSAGNAAIPISRTVHVVSRPRIELHDINGREGSFVDLNISLDRVSDRNITATLSFGDGNATAGSDYNDSDINITILSGTKSETVTIYLPKDTPKIHDPDEVFFVYVKSVISESATSENNATVSIVDIEGPPTLSLAGSINNGNNEGEVTEGEGDLAFAIRLSHRSTQAIVLNVHTVDMADGAEGGVFFLDEVMNAGSTVDYKATDENITILANTIEKNISIGIRDDNMTENDESFEIKLEVLEGKTTNSNAGATATIHDNEKAVLLMTTPIRVVEAAGSITFDIHLTKYLDNDVNVTFGTAEGNATSGMDFTSSISEVVTIPANSYGREVTLSNIIKDDLIYEGDETFILIAHIDSEDVSNTERNSTVVISDDESFPSLSIEDANTSEGGVITFEVTVAPISSQNLELHVWTEAGTAEGGSDYTDLDYSVMIKEGIDINVSTLGDAIYEGNETFVLHAEIVDTSNYTSAIGTILNNDLRYLDINSTAGEYARENGTYGYLPDINTSMENGAYIWHLDTYPAGMEINATTGKIIWNIGERVEDENITVQLSVRDTNNTLEASQTFVIFVEAVNDAPVAHDGVLEITVVSATPVPVSFELNASDIDSVVGGLTYTIMGDYIGEIVLDVNGRGSYQPPSGFDGTTEFRFMVSDEFDLNASKAGVMQVIVHNQNKAPEAHDKNITMYLGETNMTIVLPGTDVNNDILTYAVNEDVNSSYGHAVRLAGNHLLYERDTSSAGSTSFGYSVSDGDLSSETDGNITITFVLNHKPTAEPSSVTDITQIIVLVGHDEDNQELTYHIVDSPSYGSLVSADETNSVYYYMADSQDFTGTDAFTFKVNDGLNDSNIARVDIDISSTANAGYLFKWCDAADGKELWRTGGDAASTRKVKNINTSGDSNPRSMVQIGNTYFFVADDEDGAELWKSQGTTSSTVKVKDIRSNGSSNPDHLTDVNGTLFFSANDGEHGKELWRSDGTAIGTMQVRDIAAGVNSSFPSELTNVNGVLYFSANDGSSGRELWRSDGTAEGTYLVVDIANSGESSNPRELTAIGNSVYFVASDGSQNHLSELWKTNENTGTSMITDIQNNGKEPKNLYNNNGTLVFTAYTTTYGYELWTSDGTAAGTEMYENLAGGVLGPTGGYGMMDYSYMSATPRSFHSMGNVLYFVADAATSEPGVLCHVDIDSHDNISCQSDVTDIDDLVKFSEMLHYSEDAYGRRGNTERINLYTVDGTQSGNYATLTSAKGTTNYGEIDNMLLFRATMVDSSERLLITNGHASPEVLTTGCALQE